MRPVIKGDQVGDVSVITAAWKCRQKRINKNLIRYVRKTWKRISGYYICFKAFLLDNIFIIQDL